MRSIQKSRMKRLEVEAVLFDIDNTLILFDENAFFKAYITRLTPKFLDIFTAEHFQQRLIAATQALLENRGSLPNADYYLNHFSMDREDLKSEFWKRFNLFYLTEFESLRDMVNTVSGVRGLMKSLVDRGLKLVAASNPLWPLSVQNLRLSWAGVDGLPFSWITHIENSSFCKPQPEFFQEICHNTGLNPEQCLMVGNDPLNDMIAKETGMKTFQTTDSLDKGFSSFSLSSRIRRQTSKSLPEPDFRGPIRDVLKIFPEMG